MKTSIRIENTDPRLVVGVVELLGIRRPQATPHLDTAVEQLVARRAEQEDFPPADLKASIRSLLRSGGYKPSGRGKPASEYLAGAARRDAFPRISPLVDVLNFYSLLTGLPISLLDREKALAGCDDGLVIRTGNDGESYVFNDAGQEIDLAGLILVARDTGQPIGNPVKDSLATRTSDDTTDALAVIYACSDGAPADVIERMAAQLGEQFARHVGVTAIASGVISASPVV